MASQPADVHTVFQGISCPECSIEYNHLQDVYTGDDLHPIGRANERPGTKILMACENDHPWVLGIGERMGASFVYVRLPIGGEVLEVMPLYGDSTSFRFTGKPEPESWHPRARRRNDLDVLPYGSLDFLGSGAFI